MYDDLLLAYVGIAFWFLGLALSIGVPILIVKLFHWKVNLWVVGLAFALAWVVLSVIWFIKPG